MKAIGIHITEDHPTPAELIAFAERAEELAPYKLKVIRAYDHQRKETVLRLDAIQIGIHDNG